MAFSLRSLGAALVLVLAPAALQPLAVAHRVTPLVLPRPPRPLLPDSFAGWTTATPPLTVTTPDSDDQASAAALREFGLKDHATAEYTRAGRHLTLHARRFADATGAYGAFTYFRRPGMHVEDIGQGAAATGNEVLFWDGTTLVDALFENGSFNPASDKAALRAAAAALPPALGTESVVPSLPHYLPAQGLDTESIRYAIGPAGYAGAGGQLPPTLIDFSRDPEVVTAQYGKGTLTVIEYPTPQIAIARARAINAQLGQGNNPAALAVRQSGPLVAVISGNIPTDEAHRLLDKVKYEAEVTWNRTEAYVGEVKKTARLVLGILYLTGILGGSSILVGLSLGGGRAIIRRLQGKPISSLNDDEFITLNLS